MERINTQNSIVVGNTKRKTSSAKTKALSGLILLSISGLLTLSYLNDNIFMEQLAISGFIIACVAIIKLMETN